MESEKGLVDLAKMLNEQYPGDIGVLCVFLLNVVELKEGEAAFLGANMPHAYIKGGESEILFSRSVLIPCSPCQLGMYNEYGS